MEEQNKKEDEENKKEVEQISEEEKKKRLAEKLRLLRLNARQNQNLPNDFGGKQRYRFTSGGKTKRS